MTLLSFPSSLYSQSCPFHDVGLLIEERRTERLGPLSPLFFSPLCALSPHLAERGWRRGIARVIAGESSAFFFFSPPERFELGHRLFFPPFFFSLATLQQKKEKGVGYGPPSFFALRGIEAVKEQAGD